MPGFDELPPMKPSHPRGSSGSAKPTVLRGPADSIPLTSFADKNEHVKLADAGALVVALKQLPV